MIKIIVMKVIVIEKGQLFLKTYNKKTHFYPNVRITTSNLLHFSYNKSNILPNMTLHDAIQYLYCEIRQLLKGGLSSLRQFLATESPFKMKKNAFLCHLKSSPCSQNI